MRRILSYILLIATIDALLLLALSEWLTPTLPSPLLQEVALAADLNQIPITFVANEGQEDERVAFTVQGQDKMLYFTASGITFALTDPSAAENAARWILKLDFLNANTAQPIGQEQAETIVSYFRGSSDQWHTGLPTYSQIIYRDLWSGIDLAYSGTVGQLKYEFVVQPGVDPDQIRLAYRGATVNLDEAGRLEVSTPAGNFTDDLPVAYQYLNGERQPVAVAYELDEAGSYGFHLGDYDPTLPLVIDPVILIYCGYIGGLNGEGGYGASIAMDTSGDLYITGDTYSYEATFPVTVGPYLTYSGNDDVFVAKVKADGTSLIYAGYIGGSEHDDSRGIQVDTAGNAYIVGTTYSTESSFPVVIGPDLTFNGGNYDAFVAKVNADGTGLVFSGYIGGNSSDSGYGISLNAAGNAFVTGSTSSTEATFPVAVGPDLTNNGSPDAFVAKVRVNGTGLEYCGYIGGGGSDLGFGVALDSQENVYIAGQTSSTETSFPVNGGPDLTYNGGSYDAFVSKVKADGTGLMYAGYIGGSARDFAWNIAVDGSGKAYVTGLADSNETSFPIINGPDLSHNGGTDVFVAKLNSSGTGLEYCGYIGGSGLDIGYSVAVDATGNAYVTGLTESSETTFPVKDGPDLTYNGSRDAFVAKVEADGTGLIFASYIGGSNSEMGWDVEVDTIGNIFVVGNTYSTESSFPVAVGPDLTHNGSSDVYVVKFSPPPDTEPPTLPDDPITHSPLITPTLGITVQTPRPLFDWTDGIDNVGVVSYTLVITGPSALTRSLASPPVHQVSSTVSEYTPTWTLFNGSYSWAVRAHDAAGNTSAWTEPQCFFVDATVYSIYLPLLMHTP
ncbi:MAG: SBBP repeat-containing protein [Anaerolineales bacterium]|nr:SBBP repeat-containing protein [Anaerolineales bacterium]